MRLSLVYCLAAAAAGCGFRVGASPGVGGGDGGPDVPLPGDGSSGDGAADGGTDGPPQACYGSGLFHICLTTPPSTPLTFPGAEQINTESDPRCSPVAQASGPVVCMMTGSTITVNGALTVIGARPLVLLADQTITITASIDVSSSHARATTGAGANGVCLIQSPPPEDDDGGAGGGAGGSYGSMAGNGGTGDFGDIFGNMDGKGGGAVPGLTPSLVRGGCAGGDGGTGSQAGSAGAGESSGGAMYLLARVSITITASLAANGAGGAEGSDNGGGGGGGSGGLIGIEAPTINVTSVIAANGGGGGGGGDGALIGSTSGGPGGDGQISTTQAASGGVGGPLIAGGGGAGAVLTSGAGDGAGATSAGGGGGGGLGHIWIKGTLTGSGQFSPMPSLH